VCGLHSEIKALSGISGYTMKTQHGKKFLPVENWCGDTVTAARVATGLCVASLKGFVFCLHEEELLHSEGDGALGQAT